MAIYYYYYEVYISNYICTLFILSRVLVTENRVRIGDWIY
jgi:hypothetical protein